MKIIVALVDFSDLSSVVLQHVERLALAFESNVTLLHGIPKSAVVTDVGVASPVIPREPDAKHVQADLDRLEKMAEPLRASGVHLTLKQLPGATDEQIAGEALRLGADVIVVGSHHHNPLYNLLIGSVTHQVLSRAKCPVLVVSAP